MPSGTSDISRGRLFLLIAFIICMFFLGLKTYFETSYGGNVYNAHASSTEEVSFIDRFREKRTEEEVVIPVIPTLDIAAYDKKMLELVYGKGNATSTPTSGSTSSLAFVSTSTISLWPVKAAYPNYGALLPFNRIVAYYGNFYSTRMGILGEYEPEVVLEKLRAEVKVWNDADPYTPVIPAIHYIAAVAQADKGADGDYLARMPDEHIQKAFTLAKEVNGIVFLDLQFGHSSVVREVNAIASYLALPQVHLALDPEFSMKNGKKPGTFVGTLDASEINQAAEILAKIVRDNNLPPKILMVHRFTEDMVTNYQDIKPLPEVQIVMNMDGWGSPQLKIGTYKNVIYPEPVQFTGVKLFYKNDLRKPSTRMLTPQEILELTPQPSYIQYQ